MRLCSWVIALVESLCKTDPDNLAATLRIVRVVALQRFREDAVVVWWENASIFLRPTVLQGTEY